MRPLRGGRGERKTETNKGSEGLVADLKLLTQMTRSQVSQIQGSVS